MIARVLQHYFDEMVNVAQRLDGHPVEIVVRHILAAQEGGATIYILGNGGSAGTASHFACDLAKSACTPNGRRVRALSLTDSVPLMTALANDNGYETIFAEQLAIHARPGDIVIVISGSGNSPNVVKAVEYARASGLTSIGLLGFRGGRVAQLVDAAVIVPASCIEVIEDTHSVLTHAISVAVRDELALREAATLGPLRPAVFIDRDGVLNEARLDHVKSWAEFRFLPGTLEAFADLASREIPSVLVTNQSAIGRGLTTLEAVQDIHHRMQETIRRSGGPDLAIYMCPHAPWDECECRKPRPGLLQTAAEELGLDLARSVFIGDSLSDISAAMVAGCRSVYTGRDDTPVSQLHGGTVTRVSSFSEAVARVLSDPIFAAAPEVHAAAA